VAPTIAKFAGRFAHIGLAAGAREIDARHFHEVDVLLADWSACKQLAWDPKITYTQLVRIMVDADLEAVGIPPIGEGLRILEQHFDDWHRWETSVTAVLKNAGNGFE
jgi:GDPmannose 4,6-dehydratase